ncbi:hypothetical protein [Chryseobacterium polytrichastri]|uniref:Uncharacterized protein n=1 Tax=Chryseobacterium polytrichastri TaxID=1302687 RepID=A0A1M6UCJ2_9FLAO|nr:hypothetical protein [Chryseobacterium polytrichastri]SHK66768.1 hypothetical protein SAMN05444267_1006119 [Chryseobacterium polytrichastri]
MLDFYSIKDHQPTPSFPEKLELQFVGDLDDKTFGNLQNKNIIEEKFYYYSDFRWNTAEIKMIHQNILKHQLQKDIEVQKLIKILEVADKEKSGLIAYGD